MLKRLLEWLFGFVWPTESGDISPVCKVCGHSFDNHYARIVPAATQPCHHVSMGYERDCTCPNYVPAL